MWDRNSQVIAAAEAGLHVMAEKPIGTRWADGVAMVKACDDASMRLFVVKQNRLCSTLQLLKRQLQAGRFGKLAMVAVNVFWPRPQSYYDQDSWRGAWEFDGGAGGSVTQTGSQLGGRGGGGNGGKGTTAAASGTPNSGGAGDGAGYPSPGHGGAGGSGLVPLRYRLEPVA